MNLTRTPVQSTALAAAAVAALSFSIATPTLAQPASGNDADDAPMLGFQSRIVYVSSSKGSDTFDGLSPTKPKSTLAAAAALIRPGSSDWMLLKRGDEWTEGFAGLLPDGASATAPIFVSAYGTGPNPRVAPWDAADARPDGEATKWLGIDFPSLTDPNVNAPILTPGSGWIGPTEQPPPVGDSSQPGHSAEAIARWDVVPYQSFDGLFHIGVVAFHMNGIDRVEFSVDNGPWTIVSKKTINPRTNVKEYTVTLDASLFGDDPVEVRAIAWPMSAGVPRVLAGEPVLSEAPCDGMYSLVLFPDSVFDADDTDRTFVSHNGSDSDPGTRDLPVKTISKALDRVPAGGEVVVLDAGTYEAPIRPYGHQRKATKRWITIRPDHGLDREDVVISLTDPGNARPNVEKLRFRGLTIDLNRVTQVYSLHQSLWFDRVIWVDQPSEFLLLPEGSHRPYARAGQLFATDCSLRDVMFGVTGANLTRNIDIQRCYGDSVQQIAAAINTSVSGVDASASSHHTDLLQYWGDRDNMIIYNLTASGVDNAQGIFLEATFDQNQADHTIRNAALVNVEIEHVPWQDNSGGPVWSQLLGNFDHVVLDNLRLPYQRLLFRTTAGEYQNFQVTGEPFVLRNSEVHYITYDSLMSKIPDGVIVQDLIRAAEDPMQQTGD